MVNYKDYKKQLVNQVVEINGVKAMIVGVGGKAFKLSIRAPIGFTTKKELASFFVNFNSMTDEFKNHIDGFIPKDDGDDGDDIYNLL